MKLKNGKIWAIVCVASVVLTITIILIVTLVGSSPAKSTADKFMKYLKEESFDEMAEMSTYSWGKITDKFWGINVIDYSVKSVSDKNMIKHTLSTEKYYTGNEKLDEAKSTLFSIQKERFNRDYPDYEVVTDTEDQYTIQSKEAILIQYTVVYDVKYSDKYGDEKRSSMTLDITQKEPGSLEYQVTSAYGLR